MKKICHVSILACTVLGIFTPTARSDEWDKLTIVTFGAPVEVPGSVLMAGTYVFKLLNSSSNRTIVLIYNADQTKLEDKLLAVPDKRYKPTGDTVIEFFERPADTPPAIKAWFYPGSTIGLEFVYPHDRAVALAKTR